MPVTGDYRQRDDPAKPIPVACLLWGGLHLFLYLRTRIKPADQSLNLAERAGSGKAQKYRISRIGPPLAWLGRFFVNRENLTVQQMINAVGDTDKGRPVRDRDDSDCSGEAVDVLNDFLL